MKDSPKHDSKHSRDEFSRHGYAPPAIVYEGKLEVRAGSPLGRDPAADLFDPANPIFGNGK
jgi:hypothetical protein